MGGGVTFQRGFRQRKSEGLGRDDWRGERRRKERRGGGGRRTKGVLPVVVVLVGIAAFTLSDKIQQ
jgi:hypothetical protein